MSGGFSALFIRRPVATTLLTAGIAIAGAIGYFKLPVSPLPQVDYPTISVLASQPGASPETMATSVATPHQPSPPRPIGPTGSGPGVAITASAIRRGLALEQLQSRPEPEEQRTDARQPAARRTGPGFQQ